MDSQAKHRLFTREYPDLFDRIYRYVCYRITNRPDAEDVVSEVFLDAVAGLDGFDPERGNLAQWLTGVARNKIRMHWRMKQPTVFMDETMEHIVPAEPADPTLDERLAAERITRELPSETKALLAMRYIDDLTYEEIAELTGKTPEAVRKWFSRIHQTLRLRFTEDEL